jgi:hypothetical protein
MKKITQMILAKSQSDLRKITAICCLFLVTGMSFGQTYYDMSTGNYSQNFNGITTLPTNFSFVGVLSIGTIPVATKTTTASKDALTVVGTSAEIGIDATTSTTLVFLTTGVSDNTSSIATDLNLNFSNRTAGNLSYNVSTIFNNTGDRVGSLKIYYSINGTSWTELTGTNLPYSATNNVVGSGAINITLPSALNNEATVKLRFYYHNGAGGATGSRPRIGIDNLAITSSPLNSVNPLLAITGTLGHGSSCVGTPANFITYTITNTGQAAASGITVVSSGTNSSDFVVSGLSSTSIAASGGTATYNVTFTPTSTGARAATITTASSTTGSNSPTTLLTGTGSNAALTVTTPTSTAITATSATLGGNITIAGCSAITERGIYYSTAAGFANGAGSKVSVTGSFITGTFTVNASNLNANTTYYYKAFATSASGTAYSVQANFKTSCGPANIPYLQDFESITTPSIPTCNTIQNAGTGSNWITDSPNSNGFDTKVLTYEYNVNAGNAWYFTQGVNLIGGTIYTISYKYGTRDASFPENLKVAFGTAAVNTAMSNVIADYPNLTFDSVNLAYIAFTAPSTGVFYFGFNAYSAADQFYIYVDDILVDNAPSCLAPVTAATTSITGTTATLNWSAPFIVPINGYDYYYTTSSSTPTALTIPSGSSAAGATSVTLAGLTSVTTYYFWVRSNCGGADKSAWSSVKTFSTGALSAPLAFPGTAVTQTSFTASWGAVAGAASYELDIYQQTTPLSTSSTESFTAIGGTPTSSYLTRYWIGDGGISWTSYASRIDQVVTDGDKAVTLQDAVGSYLQSDAISGVLKSISFDTKQVFNGSNGVLTLKILSGLNFSQVTTIETYAYSTTVQNFSALITPNIEGPFKIVLENNTAARAAIDNLKIDRLASIFTYTIQNLNVGNVTSYGMTGLNANTPYLYRVRAKDANSTSGNSNVIPVTTKPIAANWNGTAWSNITGPDLDIEAVIDGNFTTSSSISAKSLTVSSGIFTVATGHTLTVDNAIVNNVAVGNFIVQNDAVVLQNSNATNLGLVTVKRNSANLFRQDYTSWSSPVTGMNLRAFSSQTIFSRFYSYDTAAGTQGLYAQELYTIEDNNTKLFKVAKGYRIRMPNNWTEYNTLLPVGGTSFEGVFEGILNNGNISIPLSNANTKANLVGNPYPSPISVSAFFSANPTIEPTLYLWRKRNGVIGSGYATSNGIGVTSAQIDVNNVNLENTIKLGQGFFVIANGATTLNFTNTMRTDTGGTPFFRSSNNTQELHRYWLNLSKSTDIVGQTLIGYAAGATQGRDAGIDATYFNDSPLALTSLIGNTEFSIQGRSVPFINTDLVPLGFKSDVAGTFTISLANVDGLFAGSQDLFLKDNTTGIVQNLKTGSYSFTTGIGIFNSRFEVQYTSTLSTSNPVFDANNIIIGVKNQKITINAGNVIMNKIELVDVTGKTIYTEKDVNSSTAILSGVEISNQMLVVRITTQNSDVINRKIIF